MRIGITCYPTYGGSGVVATELGIELAHRGHQVHFISYSQPIRLTEPHPNVFYHEVEVSQYPLFEYPPYDLALATRMAEVAELYDLNLLHVHYAIPHSVSAMLARQMLCCDRTHRAARRLPYVTTLHGTDITLVGLDPSYLPITRFSIEQSDAVTAISHELKRSTIDSFAIAKPIEVIHNFVNCELYRRDEHAMERRADFALPDERLLAHLSNFRPVKRVTDVIEIFDRVQKKVPARLLMMGDGPDRRAAERLACEKGIHSKIHFMGKQDRIHEKLAIADVMLLPSEMESFGLAALEAMACEVVPVASRVGGVPEVIDDGVDGFMAASGDVDAMADCALRLLTDNALLSSMRGRARAKAKASFDTTIIIPQYEALYRRLLEAKS
jgi:N-acetyl-alpha-D-glucosaminyl L-malate synthase BshA